MTAHVTYSGNPAEWLGDGPPSRTEALMLAARAASAAGDVSIPPEAGMARAAQSRAWAAVAALADAYPPASRVGDLCGHGQVVMWSGVNWVHPMDMGVCDACDRPPRDGHYFVRSQSGWACVHGCGVTQPYSAGRWPDSGPCVPAGT